MSGEMNPKSREQEQQMTKTTPKPTARKARDDAVAAAVRAGKILPSSAAAWKQRWDRDPQGTRKTLASLAAADPALLASAAPSPSGLKSMDGQLTYRGVPAFSAGGRTQVLTGSGWTPIEDVATSGLTDAELEGALAIAQSFPDSRLGRILREGPR